MTPPLLSWKDRVSLALIRAVGRLSLSTLHTVARFVGQRVGRWRSGSQYRVVHRNLSLCFPDQSAEWLEKTTEATLVSTAQTALEFIKVWTSPTQLSLDLIRDVHGAAVFHDALAAGRGVIAIVPHWGSWEVMNPWINQFTAPLIMYKPGKQPGVDALVAEARSRLNATVIPTDEGGVRALFKGLRAGRFTAILPDHIPNDQGGIYAPFFGIRTWTGVMVPKLVQRTGCAVIVMGCQRRPDGDGFDLIFQAADPGLNDPDLATATAAMNRSVEQLIRVDPTQYQWNYKRFKKNETLPNPY